MKNAVLKTLRRYALGLLALSLAGCAAVWTEDRLPEDGNRQAVAEETTIREADALAEESTVAEEPILAPERQGGRAVAEAAPPGETAPPALMPADAASPAQRAEAALRALRIRALRAEAAQRQGKGKPAQAEIEEEWTHLADEIKGAIRGRDFAAARAGLERLEAVAPRSLTLLRLCAWLALNEDRTDEARRLYRQILDRLEDDENAGVNLAILEARSGNSDAALKILAALSVRHPDSESIEAIRRVLGADAYY